MSQFRAFCKSAISAKAYEHATLLTSVALGAQGKEKAIKDTTTKILKQANG